MAMDLDLTTKREFYFTYQPNGAILCAVIADGKVVAQEEIQEGWYPQSWTEALRLMKESKSRTWTAVTMPEAGTDIELDADMCTGQYEFDAFIQGPDNSPTAGWLGSALELEPNINHDDSPDASHNSSTLFSALSSPKFPSSSLTSCHHSISTAITEPSVCPNKEPLTNLSRSPTPPPQIQRTHEFRHRNPTLSSKRTAKLTKFLETIRHHPTAPLQSHNSKVKALYNGPQLPSSQNISISTPSQSQQVSIVQFAGVLSRLGDVCTTLGFVYSLLSWEIFKREEGRMVREERVAVNLAARAVRFLLLSFLPYLAEGNSKFSRCGLVIVFGLGDSWLTGCKR